ncbi:hypothetical protein [Phorcysia thermohydrogeniphila]|uniref:Uncharacterized protein n=1 Tax=Phorcysia thermohydrogeniphila TaxID=936138 RepID=A0A4R1GHU0_9BACT|nr:hypothetical protein [Phorcysia thermohydrogeniphila]TCK05419.1 hypothetical protein CLV27_0847 [Phorcysia thermohydrogeniphila]
MAWIRVFLLVFIVLLPLASSAKEVRACIIDSYGIRVTNYVRERLEELLKRKYTLVSYSRKSCDVKVLLGTPAVVRALKEGEKGRVIYTFVMFPELLRLEKKKNFIGIRIFPLPKRTAEKFFTYTGLERKKIAVPISKDMVKLAKRYLPPDLFDLVPFSGDVATVYPKLKDYSYVYVFPDPVVLRIVNMLNLVKFCKNSGIILISGLPDLDRYDVNFIYAVDYNDLVDIIVELINENPKERIIPCPARVKVWNR